MTIKRKEFGDFQTPVNLSRRICHLLVRQGVSPASIIEPTCGKGSFVLSALEYFPKTEKIFGADINSQYIHLLKQALERRNLSTKVEILQRDFFDLDWQSILDRHPQPILILGNPPWVTNSALGALNAGNVPPKTNFQKYPGLDALTGKSNFDISEWMLIHLLQWMSNQNGVLAMLVKTAVARKVLKHLWKSNKSIWQSSVYLLDGKQEFGVSVDMCLFVCRTEMKNEAKTCGVYHNIDADKPLSTFGFSEGYLIANISDYHQWKHLISTKPNGYRWRSGLKHDAVQVMELTRHAAFYRNGLDEPYPLEDDYIYPLLKSSDLAKGLVDKPRRWVLVPQTYVGENTIHIKHLAPKTWDYLNGHKAFFDKRKSIIYRNKPRFSIFGVGDYSFATWKVAISGLYKTLKFVAIGPYQGKPVMLDDTCYFIPCRSSDEAELLSYMLNSSIAKKFFSAFIFWDAKRPITAGILARLDIFLLAKELGVEKDLQAYTPNEQAKQLSLQFV